VILPASGAYLLERVCQWRGEAVIGISFNGISLRYTEKGVTAHFLSISLLSRNRDGLHNLGGFLEVDAKRQPFCGFKDLGLFFNENTKSSMFFKKTRLI